MSEGTLSTVADTDAQTQQEEHKLRLGRIVVWVVIGLFVLFLAFGLMQAFSAQPTQGKAPDFTLETYNGAPVTLSDLRGQVVVINFWASWCAPCEEEAPAMEQAYQTYKDQGVVFLGVDFVDSEEKGLGFIQEYGISYLNGPDLRSEISDAYNIKGVPETFIVNPDGDITFFAPRPLTFTEISQEIEKAMD